MKSQNLPITGPCPIDLDAIGFDRRAKQAHCAHCDKAVTNLSNMTRDEARVFLQQNAGQKLCVSYGRRTDGTILFKQPAPAVVPLSRVRGSAKRVALPTAAALGLAAALAACTPHGADPVAKPTPVKVEPKQPEPHPEPVMAGMMEVPKDVDPRPVMVDGEMEVPEAIEQIEGQMKVPTTAIADEPCDKTKEQG
jgi:hypothetical protein